MTITRKEYKQRLEEHMTPADMGEFGGYIPGSIWPTHYATPEQLKELRHFHKGKAHLEGCGFRASVTPKPEYNLWVLTSYYTDVAAVQMDPDTGEVKFMKTWQGFSVTTLKHVNAFREMFNLKPLSKRDWIELETV